jgi:hypothetical protein
MIAIKPWYNWISFKQLSLQEYNQIITDDGQELQCSAKILDSIVDGATYCASIEKGTILDLTYID